MRTGTKAIRNEGKRKKKEEEERRKGKEKGSRGVDG